MTRASTAMAESQTPQAGPATTPDRVIVAGLGRVGLDYACALAMHASAELAGFVEPRADLRRFARGAGFQAPSETSLGRWLGKRPADTLFVCMPGIEAAGLVEQAVEAGLAVLVDGLAAMPREAVDRIEKALLSSQRPVAAGSAVLFQPTFARARRTGALSAERLQQVRASASVSRVFSPLVQPGCDVLEFLLADLLLLLDASFGPIAAVRATGQRLYGEWIDECQVEAQFAHGRVAKVEASWSVPDYPGAAMVIEGSGTGGRVIVSDDALETELPSMQGRIVAAGEPTRARSEGGEAPNVVAGWLGSLAGDAECAEALSVPRAVRVARALDAVRLSIAADGSERAVSA